MKQKQTELTEEMDPRLKLLCDELGEEAVRRIHKAYVLTAQAIYRRAVQKAKLDLRNSKPVKNTNESRSHS